MTVVFFYLQQEKRKEPNRSGGSIEKDLVAIAGLMVIFIPLYLAYVYIIAISRYGLDKPTHA